MLEGRFSISRKKNRRKYKLYPDASWYDEIDASKHDAWKMFSCGAGLTGKKTNLTSCVREWLEGEVIGSNLRHREWLDIRRSWYNKHGLTCTFGIKIIWTFSHHLIMARSQNWPDLKPPKSKFRDKSFVGTYALINSWKLHVNLLKTVATTQSQIFGSRVTRHGLDTSPEMTGF